MAKVELRDVRKSYAATCEVIHGVSIEIADGEFIVIVGPSGCGKSTLLRMVAGLESDHRRRDRHRRPRRQHARAEGPRHRDGVPELRALSAHERVRQHGLRPADPRLRQGRDRRAGQARRRDPRARAAARAQAARSSRAASASASRWAAPSCASRRCSCSTSRCRTSTPSCACRCASRCRRCTARLGTTSLYVTHDQVEAMTLAQRMIVMNAGRAEQIGAPLEVYAKPATTFVAGFIGSPPMNFMRGQERRRRAHRCSTGSGTVPVVPKAPAAGRKSTIGIRPEHLTPSKPREANLVGNVEMIEQLGADTLVHVAVAATARSSPALPHGTPAEIGEPMHWPPTATAFTCSTPRPAHGCRRERRGTRSRSDLAVSPSYRAPWRRQAGAREHADGDARRARARLPDGGIRRQAFGR